MFNSRLYVGTVFHRRVRPAVHQLQYRVFSLLLDLDELPRLHKELRGFSWNRFNALSVYDRDFGIDYGIGLRGGVEQALKTAGFNEPLGKVYLSCYPRIFGYAFNPLSVYYCHREDGTVFAVVHEVHNTFGERHVYVLAADGSSQWFQQTTKKALFVSPFAHMDMHYGFRLNVPSDKQVIVIKLHDIDGLVLTASYTAKCRSLNAGSLAIQVMVMPLMCIKVVVGIHWEALKLFAKRVPWYSHVKTKSR